jgi:hypothetical protein
VVCTCSGRRHKLATKPAVQSCNGICATMHAGSAGRFCRYRAPPQ